MSPLFLIGGLIALLGGIFWVHHVDHTTPMLKKWSSILVTMAGGITVWAFLAVISPVLSDSTVEIYTSEYRYVVLKVKFVPVRNCTLTSFRAVLIHGNNQVEIPALLITDGKNPEGDFAYVQVLNLVSFYVEEMYLESTHICPFGFEIKSQYPKLKTSEEFNASLRIPNVTPTV